MNTFSFLLSHPFVARLGWTLIHFLWEASAMALLLAAAQGALRRRSAQARYLAGCVALAAMSFAFAITFIVLREAAEGGRALLQFPNLDSVGVTSGRVSPSGSRTSIPLLATIDLALPWLVLGWMF